MALKKTTVTFPSLKYSSLTWSYITDTAVTQTRYEQNDEIQYEKMSMIYITFLSL